MDYGDPIHFTFFAVNGAGNGSKANFTYSFKMESGLCTYSSSLLHVVYFCLSHFLYSIFSIRLALFCNQFISICPKTKHLDGGC